MIKKHKIFRETLTLKGSLIEVWTVLFTGNLSGTCFRTFAEAVQWAEEDPHGIFNILPKRNLNPEQIQEFREHAKHRLVRPA